MESKTHDLTQFYSIHGHAGYIGMSLKVSETRANETRTDSPPSLLFVPYVSQRRQDPGSSKTHQMTRFDSRRDRLYFPNRSRFIGNNRSEKSSWVVWGPRVKCILDRIRSWTLSQFEPIQISFRGPYASHPSIRWSKADHRTQSFLPIVDLIQLNGPL